MVHDEIVMVRPWTAEPSTSSGLVVWAHERVGEPDVAIACEGTWKS